MADNVETLVVAVQTDGAEKLVDLAAKADQVTAATDRARDARGRFVGGSGGGGSDSSSPEAVIAIGAKKAADATDDLADKSEKGKSKVAGLGQSMLQTGRVAQDFAQGGLGGIINNIEGLTTALGLGTGAAGALTVLGTAFLVFKPQIKEFVESFNLEGIREFFLGIDQFSGRLDTLKARIKELEDKPHKLAVDVTELEAAQGVVENIKAALSEVDKLRKGQAHYESESGKAIAEQIAEAPGGSQGVDQALRGAMGPEVAARATAPIRAEMDALKAKIDDDLRAAANLDAAGQSGAAARLRGEAETKKKQLEQLDDKRLAAASDAYNPKGAIDQEVGELLKTAKTGAGVAQAEAQRKLAEALEKGGLGTRAGKDGKGGSGLAAGVQAANPQQLLLNDQADDDLEASIEAQRAGIKRRDAAAKARDAADKAARAKKKADGAPMDDAVRIFKGEQEAARAKRKADGAPMDEAVRIFKGEQGAKKAAAVQRRAGQIENQSPYYTGQQFSPEQAQHAAQRSIALQAKGLNAQQASVQAMGEMMATMAGFGAKLQGIEQKIEGIRGNNQQVNRRLRQGQPSFLRSGGPQ